MELKGAPTWVWCYYIRTKRVRGKRDAPRNATCEWWRFFWVFPLAFWHTYSLLSCNGRRGSADLWRLKSAPLVTLLALTPKKIKRAKRALPALFEEWLDEKLQCSCARACRVRGPNLNTIESVNAGRWRIVTQLKWVTHKSVESRQQTCASIFGVVVL